MRGIDDPRIPDAEASGYWRRAWAARRRLETRVGAALPRDAVALAINSVSGRSQDQLHIHISCIRPAFAEALKTLEPRLDETWSTREILDRSWEVRMSSGEDLDFDPFRLVAGVVAKAGSHMAQQTIMVVGAPTQDGPGFYILTRDTGADVGDLGSVEHMLDERCSLYASSSKGEATGASER